MFEIQTLNTENMLQLETSTNTEHEVSDLLGLSIETSESKSSWNIQELFHLNQELVKAFQFDFVVFF